MFCGRGAGTPCPNGQPGGFGPVRCDLVIALAFLGGATVPACSGYRHAVPASLYSLSLGWHVNPNTCGCSWATIAFGAGLFRVPPVSDPGLVRRGETELVISPMSNEEDLVSPVVSTIARSYAIPVA